MKPALIEQHTATDKRTQLIELDSITTRGMQLREASDSAAVARYAEAYREGVDLPPIVVFYDKLGDESGGDGIHYLADGHHRVAAAKRADLTELHAIIKKGTKRDAVLYAASANGQHGVPLTNDDKRRIVGVILADDEWRAMTDRALADMLHVSPHLVAKIRKTLPADQQTTVRKTKDGRTLDTKNIGKRTLKPRPAKTWDPADRTAEINTINDFVTFLYAREQFRTHDNNHLRAIAVCLLFPATVDCPVDINLAAVDTRRTVKQLHAVAELSAVVMITGDDSGIYLTDKFYDQHRTLVDAFTHGTTAPAHRAAINPTLPAAEPEELTAADVTDPEPLSHDQYLRELFVERLATGKFSYRASDQTLLALALITGVEGGDARYSNDLLIRSSVLFAEALAHEIAHHLTTRTTKVAQLPALPDLCNLFGISYSDLEAMAAKGGKP